MVSWSAAPGRVRNYRVNWMSQFNDESGDVIVPGDVTSTLLEGLSPETRYQVSVFAAYGLGEGEPLVGEETTDGRLCFFCLKFFKAPRIIGAVCTLYVFLTPPPPKKKKPRN